MLLLLFHLDLAQICSLLRGGIAERGGVRVGHRIIEINGQSVVAVPHERIVNLLATSVGEVCSTSFQDGSYSRFTEIDRAQIKRAICDVNDKARRANQNQGIN